MYSKEEAKQLRMEFWKKLETRSRRLPGQKGRARKWILDRTDIKGLDLRFDVSREQATVALEINHRNENRRLALYEKLESCKSIFEESFGQALVWDFLYEKQPGKLVCRVYVSMQADMYQEEEWPDIFKFLLYNMISMEKAFLEVKDFLKYQNQ
jgi:hypothetical protein